MVKKTLNPPQPDEGVVDNVRNAWALILPIIEEPTLYDASDVMQMLKAASLRLERAVQQLEERR